MMLNLLLIMTLGFLGSFGHCLGMCGPLTVAFSLSNNQENNNQENNNQENNNQENNNQKKSHWLEQLRFHLLLNTGRIFSYALFGAGIGALGSVLLAGGQLAGVGSTLRQWITIIGGLMLIWFGVRQIKPDFLPRIPFLHPILQGNLHNRLSAGMTKLSLHNRWWTPALLGMTWGLMPCGFLYVAQIKAAETGDLGMGAATMLAFGLGTLPMMLGVGVSTSLVSKDRRSQLFRMGGWITVSIGIITLLRTGQTMVDYTGHAALICLGLALIARPLSSLWVSPLRYRRALGVGAFVLSLAHTVHKIEHSFEWNLGAIYFFPVEYQWATFAGLAALLLMAPAAFTSFDALQKHLGHWWRKIHLLGVPALILSVFHAAIVGSHYLGSFNVTWYNKLATLILIIVGTGILLLRNQYFWSLFGLKKLYVPSKKS